MAVYVAYCVVVIGLLCVIYWLGCRLSASEARTNRLACALDQLALIADESLDAKYGTVSASMIKRHVEDALGGA